MTAIDASTESAPAAGGEPAPVRVVDAIATWFEQAGVDQYYGYAGGAVWPLLDALVDHPEMTGVQAKHESHAVHMADIRYRTTGKLAPVIVTKGPGLLNCVGGAATALYDMSAVMIIAGCGPTHFFGKGGMQEIYYHGFEDAVNVFRPVTKGTWLLVRPDTVIEVLNQAYNVATAGRPGPVFVQIPLDVQLAIVEGVVEPPSRRAYATRSRPDASTMSEVTELLAAAERPVLLAGGGAAHAAGAAGALQGLAERLDIPVATTLTAKGILSERHPLALGPVGRSGRPAAAEATRGADLVLAVGARFSDNHTSNWRAGKIYDVARTKIVQVNLEASEVGRNFPVDVGIAGDAASFLTDLAAAAEATGLRPGWSGWRERLIASRDAWELEIAELVGAESAPVHPARLCREVGEALAAVNGRVFIDIGDVVQYAEPYMVVEGPGVWHINPGMAEMSWASSGVLGAAADRSRPALALTGDGAFNMASNVLATAVEYDLPAVWVILNNNELGIERKGSAAVYQREHPWYRFVRKDTGEPYNPDYVKLAEAHGALGRRVERPQELRPALDEALSSGRPFVLDVVIDVSVPTYFTPGIDRAYPDTWGESYPHYGSMRLVT
ncbi:MAG TPA: thiamine pyrophosphate-binding protein [Microbacteriaceae bacterium]|jgi:acetolactate synthase-1/2/3 large subunit|nr:thiamine pyrophosphate-binding protein [Microbacteriaceae bacterium]